MYTKLISLSIACTVFFTSCDDAENRADAYGNFEADAVTISAETNGKLLRFSVEEGMQLTAGQQVALIDTKALHLQKQQILASMGSLAKKLRTAQPDIRVLQDQKANLIRERDRTASLVKAKAAPQKQLDDLNGELKVLDQRIAAARAQVNTANSGILAEKDPMQAQIAIIEDQIIRSNIHNPIDGTVLNKLAESHELVRNGSPLYRIAQLDPMIVRAYASSTQLQAVTIGQSVEVRIDQGKKGYAQLDGEISWISQEAEFTPKTIQTKEDRVNLVYAFKVRVANPDGQLKIGMPAEINFTQDAGS
ncbi:MAG: HlyD family efflux transporter periplasmic adaptor subunit [Bacteroidota bacterium]